MSTHIAGLEDLIWGYSIVLQGQELFPSFLSLAGFPEFAHLGQELRSLSSLQVASPAAVQVSPACTLLLGSGGRTQVQVSHWVPSLPCVLAFSRIKNCNLKIHRNSIMCANADLLLPNQSAFPVGAGVCWGGFWGVWFRLPVFPTLSENLASPHRPKGTWTLRHTEFVSVFCMNLTSLVGKGHFSSKVKSGVFPLNHYVTLTFLLNTCKENMTRTTESFFVLMLKTVIDGIWCKPFNTDYILKIVIIE